MEIINGCGLEFASDLSLADVIASDRELRRSDPVEYARKHAPPSPLQDKLNFDHDIDCLIHNWRQAVASGLRDCVAWVRREEILKTEEPPGSVRAEEWKSFQEACRTWRQPWDTPEANAARERRLLERELPKAARLFARHTAAERALTLNGDFAPDQPPAWWETGSKAWRIWRDELARQVAEDERSAATKPTTPAATPGAPKKQYDWRDHAISAEALQALELPETTYVVRDLLPEGLTLLAGRPKLGKSWAALEIGAAVAIGGACLGDRTATQGDVLYLALEDNRKRLQKRMKRLFGPFEDKWPARLTLTTEWRRFDAGGVQDIAAWAASVPAPRLVIVDTLAKVKPKSKRNGKAYEDDYDALTPLHRLVNDQGFAALVVTHDRKQGAEDPLDTITGTLGLAGAADTAIVLARTSKGTTLYIRGRDIEEADHAVEFNRTTCRWRILGAVEQIQLSEERKAILEALQSAGELGAGAITALTGKPRNNIQKMLGRMVEAGEIERSGRGTYRIA